MYFNMPFFAHHFDIITLFLHLLHIILTLWVQPFVLCLLPRCWKMTFVSSKKNCLSFLIPSYRDAQHNQICNSKKELLTLIHWIWLFRIFREMFKMGWTTWLELQNSLIFICEGMSELIMLLFHRSAERTCVYIWNSTESSQIFVFWSLHKSSC